MTAGAPPRMPDASGGSELPEGVTVVNVGPGDARWKRALGCLMSGRDAPRDPRVAAFEAYAARAGLDASGLMAAVERRSDSKPNSGQPDRPIAAAVAMESPGRTAMVLISPLRGGGSGDGRMAAAAACVSATVDRLPRDGDGQTHRLAIAQCLLDLDQGAEAQALRAAGFTELATLVYLQAELPGRRAKRSSPTQDDLPVVSMRNADGGATPLTLRTWDEQPETRDLFGRAILNSYRGTLDCPGLVGTRDIDDILAGHRGNPGTHAFDPHLWTVALDPTRDDEPVGVLLLSRLPEQEAMELVYLGVSDTARGRGLGRSMLRLGMAQSSRSGVRQVLLAVDENNEPAVALYRASGFGPQQRRVAWLRFLP